VRDAGGESQLGVVNLDGDGADCEAVFGGETAAGFVVEGGDGGGSSVGEVVHGGDGGRIRCGKEEV